MQRHKSNFALHLNRKNNMSVTLNNQLEELMFSSQIPDLDLTTSDDNEAVVSIVSGGATGPRHPFGCRVLHAPGQPCPALVHAQGQAQRIHPDTGHLPGSVSGAALHRRHRGVPAQQFPHHDGRETHGAGGDRVPLLLPQGVLAGVSAFPCRGQRL